MRRIPQVPKGARKRVLTYGGGTLSSTSHRCSRTKGGKHGSMVGGTPSRRPNLSSNLPTWLHILKNRMKMRRHTAELLFPLAAATSAELKHPAGCSKCRLTELRSVKAAVPTRRELFFKPLRDKSLSPGKINAAQHRNQTREAHMEWKRTVCRSWKLFVFLNFQLISSVESLATT